MALDAGKGYRALRRGRYSESNADYFLTFCSDQRQRGLEKPILLTALVQEMVKMQSASIWFLRCFVIMPDHVHLLVQLGDVLPLGKCIARFKSKTSPSLRSEGMKWQSGYFDRHLRPQEDRRPYFLYVYLNPYRAGLLATEAQWPGFGCGQEDCEWFMTCLREGLPEPEWLAGLP